MGLPAQCQKMHIQSSAGTHSLCRRCIRGDAVSRLPIKQKQGLQLGPRWSGRLVQHSGRHGRCPAASRPLVPDMPFPGDDQGSIIYSALSGLGSAADEPIAEAEEASTAATGTSPPGSSVLDGSQSNGTSTEDPKSKGPVPHRWVIVGAMALAFVLCNMDKVLPPSLFLPGMPYSYAQAAFLSIRSFSCLTTVIAQYIAYLQVNMSVAVIPMAADLGWSPSDRGLVNSAFFWGYSLTQIPAGWVSTRSASLQALLQGPHLILPGS